MHMPKNYTKLTPELQSELLNYFREGHKPATCARLAHIHPDTLARWLRDGKKRKTRVFSQFYDLVECSKAEFKREVHNNIKQICIDKKNPGVLLDMLARLFPDEYGAVSKQEISQTMTIKKPKDVAAEIKKAAEEYKEVFKREFETKSQEMTAQKETGQERSNGVV